MTTFRDHLRSNIVGYIALFVALSGTAWAAKELSKNEVKSKNIAPGQVKRSDIANSAVNSAKVAKGSLLPEDFATKQLPAGPQGPQGPPGADATKLFAAITDGDEDTDAVFGYGHGVAGVTDPGPGQGGYVVNFAQSVKDCVAFAVAGFGDPITETGTGLHAIPFVSMGYGDAQQVEVSFIAHDGTEIDTSFMIAALC